MFVVYSLSRTQLFCNPRTMARQAPLSMGFSRQEYWSGPPGSSVHGILQAGILEWVAIPFFRSPPPRDRTCGSYVSCIYRWSLYH